MESTPCSTSFTHPSYDVGVTNNHLSEWELIILATGGGICYLFDSTVDEDINYLGKRGGRHVLFSSYNSKASNIVDARGARDAG